MFVTVTLPLGLVRSLGSVDSWVSPLTKAKSGSSAQTCREDDDGESAASNICHPHCNNTPAYCELDWIDEIPLIAIVIER
jgi:hypothetical protein